MKKIFYFTLMLICSLILSACSVDDETSSKEISNNLQQYKWVCRITDEPLIDDDYQWAIFDDYIITLYFVSDYECVISYFRKHFVTDEGTSYERDSQTVKYMTQGKRIILDYSDYTGTQFVYEGDFLSSNDFIYDKEKITDYDREWLKENYKHIELDPDESTSEAFKGLKEIYADTWGGIAFGNPQCDDEGRLIYYKAMYDLNIRYEYSGNSIISTISKSGRQDSYEQNIYSLSNGLITSFVKQSFEEDELKYTEYFTIKYNSNKRIIQLIRDDGEGRSFSKHYYNLKWNSLGDIYESICVLGNETDEPTSICTYDYLSSTSQIPCMIWGCGELRYAFNMYIDPILVMEGYYGNSTSKHNLKSSYELSVYRQEPELSYNWSYSIDTKGRITKIQQESKYLDYDVITELFTFKWE